jgi:GNAT superfamily N-acetyltransferase
MSNAWISTVMCSTAFTTAILISPALHTSALLRRGRIRSISTSGNRRRGIGTALISRAALHARNQGIPLLFMQCLRENHAIIRIARALGMRVVAHGPECEASLPLRRGNPATFARELWEDGIALCDYSLRAHFLSPSKIRSSSSLHAARDAEDAKAA